MALMRINSSEIAVMNTGGQGQLNLKETMPCEGENPRGLVLSPDGGVLLCADLRSGSVSVFDIPPDGMRYFAVFVWLQ